MSDRKKELIYVVLFFAAAVLFAVIAFSGKIAIGEMSIPETKEFCIWWSIGFAACSVIALIGGQRLNDWISPRLEAYLEKRKAAKARREALRKMLDLKDPSRVERRKRRKEYLLLMASMTLVLSPLIAIIVTSILTARFKTETCYMLVLISILYAVQLWGYLTVVILRMKKAERNEEGNEE